VNRVTPLILAVALFMEMMDSTVIATSLPAIAADIGTSPIALKLAMTTYLVALAIFIPVSGWVADRFGAKNVFRAAILVFMLGSLACAFSNSLEAFVASRFLQGMGGSMMAPLARLVLVRATPKKDLVDAMAWLAVPALIGPMVGPPLGGFLTTFVSWHWIFFINIPIGLIGIVLSTRYLPEIPSGPLRRIDWLGFVLAGTAFSGLLFGLSVLSMPALPPVVGTLTLVVGAVALMLYLRHARRSPAPLLDLSVFRDRLFRSATIGGSVFRVGIGATPFLMPLMLQVGFGMTAFDAGLVLLFGALGAIAAKLITKRVYVAVGFRTVLVFGSVISAMALAVNGWFTPETPLYVISAVMLLAGLVRSTFFTGINAMQFAEMPDELAAQASAISSVGQQLSLATGVAVGGGLIELMARGNGGIIQIEHFHIAFWFIAAISASAALVFLFLPRDAGSAVSGHVQAGRLPREAPGE
jgi:EmrB/QacA subfamily drug resistance transporter